MRAVKFWSLGTSTRIAIEVSDDFRYKFVRLENPDRLFFDIGRAKPRLEGGKERGTLVIPVNDTFVRQIRVAEPQPGTTRVVLDLQKDVEFSASQITGPDRLVIEVRHPGPAVEAPTVTPAVVVMKRFEAPVVPPKAPMPRLEITALDEPPPLITLRAMPSNLLPAPKSRRLLSSAVANLPLPPKLVQPPPDSTPTAASRNSTGDRSLTRVFGLKVRRVIIDAGHGGHDTGSTGPTGLQEKDVALDVAKRTGALIHERLRLEVIYTRSDDTFISLEERPRIANAEHGDLFLSIHTNSSTVKAASGVESYYLSFSSTKVDLDLAARENAGSQGSVSQLHDLLEKAMLNDKLKESSEFAGKVMQALTNTTSAGGAKARNRGVRRAPFIVLIGTQMPAVLAEVGFISNPAEEALMAKPAHRQKIAEALTKGVQDFAQSLGKYQVAVQPASATVSRGTK